MGKIKRKYTLEDWRNVREALRSGLSVRQAAKRAGVGRGAALRWSHSDEPPERIWLRMDVEPAERPAPRGPGARLSYEDRVMIFQMAAGGRPLAEVARAVGCHRTTVARELRRCPEGAYDPRVAQRDADRRARRPKPRKPDANPRLRAYVANGLSMGRPPEQVSARVRDDFPGEEGMRVSCETVCQSLYLQGRGRLRDELGVRAALRSGRARRKPRSKLPARDKPWVEGRGISARPPEAADRAAPGHWEGDLAVGGDMASRLTALVERRSRLLLMSRLTVRDADTVEQRLVRMAASIPAELQRTLTWDQGSEMARAADFELATPFKAYFCDPRSPWERPTNENANGLIREYFPKGTKLTEVTDEEVSRAQWLLNNRPRKVLGWKFPSEAMAEVLNEGAAIA